MKLIDIAARYGIPRPDDEARINIETDPHLYVVARCSGTDELAWHHNSRLLARLSADDVQMATPDDLSRVGVRGVENM